MKIVEKNKLKILNIDLNFKNFLNSNSASSKFIQMSSILAHKICH